MPDTEVLERETVADPKTETSPQGERPAEGQGNVNALAKELKGMDADEARAFLENLDPEVRDEVVEEYEKRGEQRARTRKQETESATDARSAAYAEIVRAGLAADQGLGQIFDAVEAHAQNFDYEAAVKTLDKRKLAQLVVAYGNGQVAAVGKENDAKLQAIEAKYADQLKDLTPAQQKRLDDAHWKDARQGTLHAVEVLLEVLIARAEESAEERGVERGKTTVKPELLERISKARTTSAALAPRVKGGPAGGSVGRSILDEIEAVDPHDPQAQQKLDELGRRLRARR